MALWEIISPSRNLRRLKYLWQRITRGFDDSEVWDLDYRIAKFILPRLKRLKEIKNGWPSNLKSYDFETYNKLNDKEMEQVDIACQAEWNQILDKIIYTFELIIDEYGFIRATDEFDYTKNEKEFSNRTKQYEKEIEEGLKLFIKYYSSLWD